MTHRGPCQPPPFCDSVILWVVSFFRYAHGLFLHPAQAEGSTSRPVLPDVTGLAASGPRPGQRSRGRSWGTCPGCRAVPSITAAAGFGGFWPRSRALGPPKGPAAISRVAGAPSQRFAFNLSVFNTILKSVLCWQDLGKEKEKKELFFF